MPELKRIPQEGKMNLDFHERILPPGQYREALNVNIGRSETSEVGTVENLLGNQLIEDIGITGATCIGSYRDNGRERIFFFVTTNDSFDEGQGDNESHRIYQFDQISGRLTTLVSADILDFHVNFPITGVNLIEDLLFWTDDRNEPRKINIDTARNNNNYYNSNVLLSVAKPAPSRAADVLGASRSSAITSTFLEDKLPRFSYRWRFEDGEYSVLAPFTPIVFRTNLTEIPAIEAGATGAVSGFTNSVNLINLSVPVQPNAGITSVELIYTDSSTTNAYIVEDLPVPPAETAVGFEYRSQDPFRTLPNSQITRVFDNVPRRAKAQEVAGGRVVYGNYLQNYNLPDVDFSVSVERSSNPIFPNQFVKSRRTYEVGIVLSDESGRTTPVILSNGTVFVDDPQHRLNITFDDVDQLSGFFSYKVVVKQTQQEYYNLFTGPVTGGGFSRSGDNASKVPIDFTEGVQFGATDTTPRPSSRSIYVNGTLQRVTINPNGTIAMPTGLSTGTYEVEPVESELDIFFESPTGGEISQISAGTSIPIDYYNCYYIDGVEANRIRMGFNDPAWDYGVRAHATDENFAGEERRQNTLIHSSGFFNSRTGLNQLNQFNESEGGLTLSLDPADGSIQLLYAEDTQLIIWQEDKVSRSPIDKDFIYSAEGGAVPVTSNTQYLGTVAPYAGEYGISTDPQSFAVYGTRKYFTDRNRGVVLRLSNDGLTEISQAGMNDFFRDALRTSTSIIGSFDEYHNTYNLTINGDGYQRSEDTNLATAGDDYFTIGFEEDVNGWVSFKSFQQESGTTLNNVYYTFNGGNLWQHNVENTGEDTDVNRVRRNRFYNMDNDSHIEFIFNDGPSNVKTFNTIGYEGTEGWGCEYIRTDIDQAGQVPEPNTSFADARLLVDGSADNTTVTGERTNIVRLSGDNPTGSTTWIVRVSPISLQYAIANEDDVTLTIGGVPVSGDNKSLSNGSVYFLINRDITGDETIRATLGGDGAGLAFRVTLLAVNITGTAVTNPFSNIDRVSLPLNTPGLVTERVRISAANTHYIPLNTGVSVDVTGQPIESFISSAAVVDYIEDSDDVTVDLNFNVPMDPVSGAFALPINVTTVEKPELLWAIPLTGIDLTEISFNTSVQVATPVLVSPRDPDPVRSNELTFRILNTPDTLLETKIIDLDNMDIIINSVDNGSVSVPLSVDSTLTEATATVLSNIDLNDTTTTVNITAALSDASLTVDGPAGDTITLNYDGTPGASRTFVSNVDVAAAVEEDQSDNFNVVVDNINNNVTIVGLTDIMDDQAIETTLTISPALARLTGLDTIINVTQRARYFSNDISGHDGNTINFIVSGPRDIGAPTISIVDSNDDPVTIPAFSVSSLINGEYLDTTVDLDISALGAGEYNILSAFGGSPGPPIVDPVFTLRTPFTKA